MRFLLPLALAVIAAFQNPPATPPRDPVRTSADPTASISGRVTDAESGRPIPNAIVMVGAPVTGAVTIESLLRPRVFEAVAGPDGRYALAGLPAGDYRVLARPADFTATHRAAPLGGGSMSEMALGAPLGAPSVSLTAGESRANVDIALPRAFAIEGRVLDGSARLLAGVIVQAETAPDWHAAGRSLETDDRGRFRLYGLPPGTYRVCAQPREFRIPAHTTGPSDVRLVPTCYPSAEEAHGAALTLTITTADLLGVDIQVQRSGAYRLSGHVVSESGAPALDAHVNIARIDGRGSHSAHPETKDGTFVARGLIGGVYSVHASVGGRDGERGEIGATEVRIDGADVSGVAVRTSRGATVRGRVAFEGRALPSAALLRLSIGAKDDVFGSPARRQVLESPPRARPADDRTFELTRLFHPVAIDVSGLPDGWAVKSVAYHGADMTDRIVEFASSADPDALRIVLTDQVARLRVRVSTAPGATPVPAPVFVVPADPERRAGLRIFGKAAAGGEVDFGAFAPGDYLVAAVPLDAPPSADGRSALEQLLKGALRVTLVAGDDRVVDVEVTRFPSGR
jgi:hypothetical protein